MDNLFQPASQAKLQNELRQAIASTRLDRIVDKGSTNWHSWRMLKWEQITVDARDPASLGGWWANALGWVVVDDNPEVFEIRPTPEQYPGLLFLAVPEAKSVKNRLHLDLRPDDRASEVARFLSLGAVKADVGQGEQTWVVLRDPEGNEFCVLSSHQDVGNLTNQTASNVEN